MLKGASENIPVRMSSWLPRPNFGSQTKIQPEVTAKVGIKKVTQNSSSAKRAPGISVRAITQAINMAIGMEIPCTRVVTIKVLTKALPIPGSLNAARHDAQLELAT